MLRIFAILIFSLVGCNKIPSTKNSTLIFAFQKQKDPKEIEEHAKRVAQELSRLVGQPIEVMIPASYTASVQALVSNRAQVAYLSAIPFMLARAEAPVKLVLAEERDQRTDYDSVFVVRQDSPFATLADLRGTRMMFTSATSTSGYVMAYARLIHEGLLKRQEEPKAFFSDVQFAGSYDRALLSVVNGQADVCAVSDYTVEGPKADVYLPAAQRAQLRILTRTSGVPTHLIAMRTDLAANTQQKIFAALQKISQEKPELLADVYGASRFVAVDENAHLRAAQKAIEDTGLQVSQLAQ